MTKALILCIALSALLYSDGSKEWTPAKCHVYGVSIAHRLKDTLQELRYVTCQNSVAKTAKKLGWDDNCSQVAMLACISELDSIR